MRDRREAHRDLFAPLCYHLRFAANDSIQWNGEREDIIKINYGWKKKQIESADGTPWRRFWNRRELFPSLSCNVHKMAKIYLTFASTVRAGALVSMWRLFSKFHKGSRSLHHLHHHGDCAINKFKRHRQLVFNDDDDGASHRTFLYVFFCTFGFT